MTNKVPGAFPSACPDENEVVELLVAKHLTISTAESCTGGLIAATIVNVPGASETLMSGAVTYSNDAKENMLGVKEETLRLFGAVSAETAEEMARGGAERMGTDLCVSSTGVAGPGGGTPEKPVGLVYIACAMRERCEVRRLDLSGDRTSIRYQTVRHALQLIKNMITEG